MAMDEATIRALETDRVVDITTTGRTSGQPRRIETWLYWYDGRLYLAGSPGKRDWYANLLANPALTIHLKQSLTADVPATARPVADAALRKAAFTRFVDVDWKVAEADRARFIAESRLMSLHIEGLDQPR